MRLYLIRHGQSHVNLPDWNGGNVDAGLTDLGQQQAERVAAWLVGRVSPVALYASTMRRARETAACIAESLGMNVTHDDRLREVGNCYMDASPVALDDDPPTLTDFWASEQPFEPIFARGESWMHFIARVGSFISDVIERHPRADDTVLAVCHGGVMNAAIDVVFGVGPFRRSEVWIYNTGLIVLEHLAEPRVESWRVHGINLAYHLLTPEGSLLGYTK